MVSRTAITTDELLADMAAVYGPSMRTKPRLSVELSSAGSAAGDEAVVAAAARLILRDGLDQAKMVDIAEEAGVGVATVYRHFQTKTRLAAYAGTLLWKLVNQRIRKVIESDEFLAMSGRERLELLFGCYAEAYVGMPDFVAFVNDFDHAVLAELGGDADKDLLAALASYGEVVDSFYFLFEDCYELGISDGSINCKLDFRTYYHAVAHALMGVAAKFVQGQIIPSDAVSDGRAEIDCLIDMAVRSLTVT